ncbi:hypothetical protein OFB99_25785, partial [Escherichia coli]|nr:hypothetical protein [Escherichia coli]
MSRIRVVAARLYAAFIHAQLFVMSCRSKLTKFLLLIPMMLLPKAVLADGDLADMVRNVEPKPFLPMEILPIWFAMS